MAENNGPHTDIKEGKRQNPQRWGNDLAVYEISSPMRRVRFSALVLAGCGGGAVNLGSGFHEPPCPAWGRKSMVARACACAIESLALPASFVVNTASDGFQTLCSWRKTSLCHRFRRGVVWVVGRQGHFGCRRCHTLLLPLIVFIVVKNFQQFRAHHLAQHRLGNWIGLGVVVNINVQPVHHVVVRIGKQLFPPPRFAHPGQHCVP